MNKPDTLDYSTTFDGFAEGTSHAGFTVEHVEQVDEIDGTAYVMRHDATGARAMWLACPDSNKSFSITFKTPPANSTGVFHILEHSVLCGSDRYPVKEPFVNLLKTSMKTFLNALTFSDKTMYPVASTNERDLMNLMGVYLDAVLCPAIYHNRRIFEQEGWHYEVDDDGTLTYNGVVFNEMKGALSDPDEVLFDALNRSLFPESPYRFESGGEPRVIPTLTYEEFLDTHARHYRLDNSYVVLYGNIDPDEVLGLIDERFLAACDRGAGEPNPLELQSAVSAPLATVSMQTAPENACVGLSYVFGTSHDRERVLATDVLMDALMGSNEAPLKRALLDADLADDAQSLLVDGILQPMVMLELKGAREGVAARFRELVESTCADLVRDGIGHDNLASSLAQAEFNLREGDWGYPDGVALSVNAMSGWLYDDADATAYLRYEDAFAHMREGMDTGYFERLLDELVCSSKHSAEVELVPSEKGNAAAETDELAHHRASLDASALAAIATEVDALRAAQEAPDAPEDLAKLPQLTVADIEEAAPEPQAASVTAPLPCIHHEIKTRHIDYVTHYFDLSCVGFQELPYVSVLATLLGGLDTKMHTAQELDTLIEERLGSLSFGVSCVGDDHDPLAVRPLLVVNASSLSSNVDWLATLPSEIWSSTLFGDKERVHDILQQQRVSMEQTFIGAGHACALSRVSSYFSSPALVAEQTAGVDYYLFLKKLLGRFDARYDGLCECLRNLCARILVTDAMETSFTGDDADLARFWETGGTLRLEAAPTLGRSQLSVPTPTIRNEAFVVPADVCFVGQGANGLPLGFEPSGAWDVASRVLSYDYLWNEVRVKGGAYGCGFSPTPTGMLRFHSYRDPAIDPTLERFAKAGEWLSRWQPSDKEFEGYVVSTVAGHDAPVKPRTEAARQDILRLWGRPATWREQVREQELAAMPQTIRSFAPIVSEIPAVSGVAVFAGRDIIKASKRDFDVVELMGGSDS